MTEKRKKQIARVFEEIDRLAKKAEEARKKIPGADKFNSTEALMRFRYGEDGTDREDGPRRERHA